MNLQLSKPPHLTPLCAIAFSLLSACSGVRVVTIPTTEPLQLAEPIKAYVFIQTNDGKRTKSNNRVQLYEGEWILEDPNNK